jgi:hypothetical protein
MSRGKLFILVSRLCTEVRILRARLPNHTPRQGYNVPVILIHFRGKAPVNLGGA